MMNSGACDEPFLAILLRSLPLLVLVLIKASCHMVMACIWASCSFYTRGWSTKAQRRWANGTSDGQDLLWRCVWRIWKPGGSFDLPFCLYCRMFLKLLPIPIAGIHEASCCCNSYHLSLLFRFVMNEELSSDPRYLLTKMRDLKTKMQVVLTSPLFEGEDISSREIADAIFDKVSTYWRLYWLGHTYRFIHLFRATTVYLPSSEWKARLDDPVILVRFVCDGFNGILSVYTYL